MKVKTYYDVEQEGIPFLFMNYKYENIINQIKDIWAEYENFDVVPIPNEVEKLIRLSYEKKYFDEVRIYGNINDEFSIFFVVGLINGKCDEDCYYYKSDEKYLIGMWGTDEYLDWNRLAEVAVSLYIDDKLYNTIKILLIEVKEMFYLKKGGSYVEKTIVVDHSGDSQSRSKKVDRKRTKSVSKETNRRNTAKRNRKTSKPKRGRRTKRS